MIDLRYINDTMMTNAIKISPCLFFYSTENSEADTLFYWLVVIFGILVAEIISAKV